MRTSVPHGASSIPSSSTGRSPPRDLIDRESGDRAAAGAGRGRPRGAALGAAALRQDQPAAAGRRRRRQGRDQLRRGRLLRRPLACSTSRRGSKRPTRSCARRPSAIAERGDPDPAPAGQRRRRPGSGRGAARTLTRTGLGPGSWGCSTCRCALFERTGSGPWSPSTSSRPCSPSTPAIDGLFRSRIQRHGDAASYVFAGSHPGPDGAAVRRARAAVLRPGAGAAARPARRTPTSSNTSARASKPPGATRGRRSNRCSTWPPVTRSGRCCSPTTCGSRRPAAGSPTPSAGRRRCATVFAEHDDALRATWDALEAKERAVFAALAMAATRSSRSATLERFNLSKGGAQHARDALAHAGHIRRTRRRLAAGRPPAGALDRRFPTQWRGRILL